MNQSKSELQMINSRSEFSFAEDSGFSDPVWIDKPGNAEEHENLEPENLKLHADHYSRELSSGSSLSEMRRRPSEPPISAPVSKKKYVLYKGETYFPIATMAAQNDTLQNHEYLADQWVVTCFNEVKHPSVQLMIDLSERYQTPFRDVFEQFEQLRRSSQTECGFQDDCIRTRDRFRLDGVGCYKRRPNVRQACLDTFKKLDLKEPIDEKYVHLILEYNPIGWIYSPACIRNEWNSYRDEIDRILTMSPHKFHNDQLFLSMNVHPSVEEMVDVSVEADVPYRTVYERFVELRYAERVTCDENDACQIIRRSTESSRCSEVSGEIRRGVMEEFDKHRWPGNRNKTGLTLFTVHSVMVRHPVSYKEIRQLHAQWLQDRRRRRQDKGKTPPTDKDDVEDSSE